MDNLIFDFEVRRMAAAFGVSDDLLVGSEPSEEEGLGIYFIGAKRELIWYYNHDYKWSNLKFRINGEKLYYSSIDGVDQISRHSSNAIFLVKALYKLGIPIQKIEEQFGSILSHHDMLSCRNELPPEFWPIDWGDQDVKSSSF